MLPPNLYYTTILMTASIFCLVVAVIIFIRRKGAAGSTPLAALLLSLSWWDITYALFWDDFPGPTPYFWLDITLLGAFIAPTAFLVFALEFSGTTRRLSRPILLALMIEPALAFILQWTDPWHDLFFGGKRVLNTTMILDAGPVSWANIYYSYALILIGIVILARMLILSSGVYRKQAALALGAVIAPWLAHIGFVIAGHGLLPNADMTPFIFSITALVLAYALLRFHLLDVVPIARSVLIENMSEGVVVLDSQNRVVDVNPIARQALPPEFSIGDRVEKAFANFSELLSRFFDKDQEQVEIKLDERYLDLRISPLFDANARKVGRLVVWRDITDLKISQIKLERFATTDELTLTHNRRHFMELAEAQINRSQRNGQPLTLALIDLDYFKKINDGSGHLAGDKVLAGFARLIQDNIRDFDIFSRLGGEEFALLMTDTGMDAARQVMERLREIVANSPIIADEKPFSITFSSGVSEMTGASDSLESLLSRADHALYAAKAAGRNRILVWGEKLEADSPAAA